MFKRNRTLIAFILLTIGLCTILICKGIIDISILLGKDKGIHFNLLTVSSIIGGFMFSGLGLLVGVSGNKLMKELDRAQLMDSIYNNVIAGILFSVISIIFALIMIFNIFIMDIAKKYIVSVEIIALALGIVCFFLSVIDLKFIIASIHEKNKVIPDSVIKNIKNQSKKPKAAE